MKYGRSLKSESSQSQMRKLKTKPLIVIIAVLFICNALWFFAWLIPDKPKMTDEEVASVDGKAITRERWLAAMEKEVGRETLLSLVNEQVMEAAAEKFKITVTDKEVDLELAIIHSVDNRAFTELDKVKERQKVRSALILEKVLTKDVVIDDEAIESNYKDNASMYDVQTAYRTSIIVLPTKEEADQTLKELGEGSSFEVLAKESSVDSASSNLGGDIGYINSKTENIDRAIVEAASALKEQKMSTVIALENGLYAIIKVNDIMDGRAFTYDEVKGFIKRSLALEQLPKSVNPEAFWKEFKAEWFYGE